MRKAAIILMVVGAVLFAVTAATAVAAPGKGGGQEKVTLCHKGKTTIIVGAPAAKGHAKHGDVAGACGGTTGGTTGGASDPETVTP